MRIEALDERWAGSVRVGLTAPPPGQGPPTHPALPPTLLDLPSPPTWLVTGAEVRHNGTTARHNYGVNLERLTVSIGGGGGQFGGGLEVFGRILGGLLGGSGVLGGFKGGS